MATARKKTTIGFYVSPEVADRAKELFPDGRTEEILVNLLDLYENAGTPANDTTNELYAQVVEEICNTYTVEPDKILEFINSSQEAFNASEQENGELKKELETQKSLNEVIRNENDLLKQQCEQLEILDWAKIRTTIKPFAVSLIELTAIKLSAKYGREVQPMQILVDMFMRYTIERYNQWFYPFQLNDTEILAAAQAINPEISSIRQIKKTLSTT